MRDFMAVSRGCFCFDDVKLIIFPSCLKMVKRGASASCPRFFSQILSGEFVDIIAGFSRVLAACKGPGFVYTSTNPTHLLSLSACWLWVQGMMSWVLCPWRSHLTCFIFVQATITASHQSAWKDTRYFRQHEWEKKRVWHSLGQFRLCVQACVYKRISVDSYFIFFLIIGKKTQLSDE